MRIRSRHYLAWDSSHALRVFCRGIHWKSYFTQGIILLQYSARKLFRGFVLDTISPEIIPIYCWYFVMGFIQRTILSDDSLKVLFCRRIHPANHFCLRIRPWHYFVHLRNYFDRGFVQGIILFLEILDYFPAQLNMRVRLRHFYACGFVSRRIFGNL